MIGHAVLCRGRNEAGVDALAVWQVDTEGVGTGAWVAPVDSIHGDPSLARMLVERCVRRAVIAWDPAVAINELTTLEQIAGLVPGGWAMHAITLYEILDEIGQIRATFEKRVAEERQSNKSIVPLDWDVDMPEPLPDSVDGFRKSVGLAVPTGSPAVQDALLTVRLVRWSVLRWQETRTAHTRRAYLQQSLARCGVLPPLWATRIAGASSADQEP